MNRRLATALIGGALVLSGSTSVLLAQMKFSRGQSVAPIFEGWRKNPDGSYLFYFGYLNRNYEQTLDLPVGANNRFEPGAADRGQPTHFIARRQRFVFTVAVPKDWDPKARLTWTVIGNGQEEKAHGWLQPEWEIDDGVIAMNIGGGSSPPMPNIPPKVTGSATATASVGMEVALSASATDDGVPKPRKSANPNPPPPKGVSIRWQKYRGPGDVRFSAPTADGLYAQPTEAKTSATFSAPGIYTIRAVASDGYLESVHTIDVTVK